MTAPYILLGFLVFPLWIVAGFGDYLCHRAARISQTSGTPESILHLVQFAVVGLPATLGLFLKANAGFFALAAMCIVLHHGIAYIDVRYANGSREVMPREQMVHSFLEILPITAYVLLAAAEWGQLLALLGLGEETAVFGPQPRVISLPYAAFILTAALMFNLLPYIEEFFRCFRARSNKG